MRSVLSVASLPPFPPGDGLHTRTWNLLGELAKSTDVTLLTWNSPETSAAGWEAVRRRFSSLEVLAWHGDDTRQRTRARRQIRFLLGEDPPYIQQALSQRGVSLPSERDEFLAVFEALRASRRFDAVVLEDEAAAAIRARFGSTPVVVHRLNVFSSMLADLRSKSVLGRQAWRMERRAWTQFDRSSLADAAAAVAPTTEVRDALAPLVSNLPWTVISNGIDVPAVSVEPGGSDVVFIGWMKYPPNVDAVSWFAREVWPQVRAASPASRFRIIGRAPTPQVEELGKLSGVEVVGEVPEIAAACAGAAVGVVPLRAGMGIKNKTLELMALGLPVVATPAGAEGISASRPEGLMVATDRHALTREVTTLLRNRDLARRLGSAAQAHVRLHHSWEQWGIRYRAFLEEVVDRYKAKTAGS